jgi:hypothetical protein
MLKRPYRKGYELFLGGQPVYEFGAGPRMLAAKHNKGERHFSDR